MGITFMCPPGSGNAGMPITVDSIDGTGVDQSTYPNLNAQRINLCIQDVQETIQEGRAQNNPMPIFNISGATGQSIW